MITWPSLRIKSHTFKSIKDKTHKNKSQSQQQKLQINHFPSSFTSLIRLLMRIRLFQHSLYHSLMLFRRVVHLQSLLTFKIPRTPNTVMLPWTWFLFVNLKFLELLGVDQVFVNLVMVLHVVLGFVEGSVVRLVLPVAGMTLLDSSHWFWWD